MAKSLWNSAIAWPMTIFTRTTPEISISSRPYTSVASDEIELTDTAYKQHKSGLDRSANHPRHDASVRVPFWKVPLDDLKATPWSWLLRRFVSHTMPLIVIFTLVTLIQFMSMPYFIAKASGDACGPDASFELSLKEYTPWKRNAIFAINMGYGSYSFGIAKFIDIIWDILVGRGGQVLLAFFSYKTFTKALCRIMERSTVSTRTFKSLTLQNDTFFGVLRLMRDFNKTSGAQARLTMLWIILSALFVLLFPTWLSAMTGYTADVGAFVEDATGNLVLATAFSPIIYTIRDGARLGDPYTDDYQVTVPFSNDDVSLDYKNSYACSRYPTNCTENETVALEQTEESCLMLWLVSLYTSENGFQGLKNVSSIFTLPDQDRTNITLLAPTLDITAHLTVTSGNSFIKTLSWACIPYGLSWKNPNTRQLEFAESDPQFMYGASKTTYNLDEVNKKGSCQQQNGVRYKWGFSFLLLYTFLVTFLVWIIGMFALYLDAYLHSRLDTIQRHMGIERAVLDLSSAMHQNMDDQNTDLHDNPKLKELTRGKMTYSDLPLDSLPSTRWTQIRAWWRDYRFWPWLKREKWWFVMLIVFTIMFVLSWTGLVGGHWSPPFSVFPMFGALMALFAGEKAIHRWLVFLFFFLLFVGLEMW